MRLRLGLGLLAVAIVMFTAACGSSTPADQPKDSLGDESVCSLLYFSPEGGVPVGKRMPSVFAKASSTSSELTDDEGIAKELLAIADVAPPRTDAALHRLASEISNQVKERRSHPESGLPATAEKWKADAESLHSRCADLGLPDG